MVISVLFMPTEWVFDALSRNAQYTSLCFIKFKLMDQTILYSRNFSLRKQHFSFDDLFLNFSHIISTKMYEQYVFKHLMVYMIWICVSQDRFRLLHKWKMFQSVNGTATENHLCFIYKTSF